MKKIIIILFVLVSFKTIAQDTNNGKPNFKIFWNYHNDFSKEVKKKSAFELKRVYLGYKHDFNDNISAKVTYDIGSNSAGSAIQPMLKLLNWTGN